MASILDFTKWTLALAVAQIFWLQSTFLPTGDRQVFVLVLAVMAIAALSAILGVALYARATKVLAENPDATFDDLVRVLGRAHAVLLVLALVGSAGLFIGRLFQPAEPAARCTLTAGEIAIEFDCAEVKP